MRQTTVSFFWQCKACDESVKPRWISTKRIIFLTWNRVYFSLLVIVILLFSPPAPAEEIRVSVASNFLPTLQKLSGAYQQSGRHRLRLSSGSSGKLYAQIVNRAPFDLFFSADAERPIQLEKQGFILPASRKTYAIGQLVLWHPSAAPGASVARLLQSDSYRRLAIANPRFAPYGKAAQQVLVSYGLWPSIQSKLVRGENIAQAFQFVQSGNAQLGLVAYAQIVTAGLARSNEIRRIDQSRHEPIEQQYVVLTEKPANQDFLRFLQSDTAKTIILNDGYLLPEITEKTPHQVMPTGLKTGKNKNAVLRTRSVTAMAGDR